jgi:hypothetical protein
VSGYTRESLRLAIYRRDSFRCIYCGFQADILEATVRGTHPDLELDHVEPQIKGGGSGAENMVACCLPCNDLKHDKDLSEFLAVAGMVVEEVRRRLYLAKRRRVVRGRKKALELMRILKLLEEARCPWCDKTCDHCFDALAKVTLLGGSDAYVEG